MASSWKAAGACSEPWARASTVHQRATMAQAPRHTADSRQFLVQEVVLNTVHDPYDDQCQGRRAEVHAQAVVVRQSIHTRQGRKRKKSEVDERRCFHGVGYIRRPLHLVRRVHQRKNLATASTTTCVSTHRDTVAAYTTGTHLREESEHDQLLLVRQQSFRDSDKATSLQRDACT